MQQIISVHVSNVGKPSSIQVLSNTMKWFTVERKLRFVISVEKRTFMPLPFDTIK